MTFRQFVNQVQSDMSKFERVVGDDESEPDGDSQKLDYGDWFELFIEHTMPQYE